MTLPATIGGKYNVVQRLGKGGMGTVFEALVSGTGERVAVKVIAADLAEDESIVLRFQREARTAASLDTPHIVKVIEAGVDELTQLPFMAMEYLEGEDLRQLLKRLGPLPSSLALRIAAQACRALEAAHTAKILHRDIKPANLFIAKQGGERVVKLLDFGVAKMQHSELTGDAEQTNLTRTGSMIGSPLYMSPEQARGYRDIDGRSDLWSLGVVLYQMLCGKTPHKKIDELGELLVRICTEPPPPLRPRAPWVPPYIANLVHRSLAMSADERFQSAGAMLEALGELMPEGATITEPMLRPLSENERAISAELTGETRRVDLLGRDGGVETLGLSGSHAGRFSQSVPAVMAVPGYTPSSVPDSPTVPTGHAAVRGHSTLTIAATTTGITAPTTPPAPNRKPLTIAAAVLISAVAAAAVFLGLMRDPEPSPGASGSGAKEAGEARARSVNVVVLPEDAKIELDGAAAKVEDGIFEITGTMGSVHKVKISLGQATRSVDVVITENGASPPKIEIEAAARAATATAAPGPTQAPLTGVRPRPQPTPARTATPNVVTTGAPPALRDDR